MIIVKFQGALGNQMFEYALYKRLMKIYPDNEILAYVPKIKDFNGFELEKVFGITLKNADWRDIVRLSMDTPEVAPHYKLLKNVKNLGSVITGIKSSHLKQDDNTAFYQGVFNLNPLRSYYLDGVWANVKYFGENLQETKQLFQFALPLDNENILLAKNMEDSNSVAIHVRRNEYVSLGLTVTSDDYYRRAIELIRDTVESPRFYVFSDDHDYCKKLFNGMIEYKLIEGNTDTNSYKDLQLMTFCKHNIIANSTFSFWGAFLGNFANKIVIAPKLSWGHMRYPFVCDSWNVLDA